MDAARSFEACLDFSMKSLCIPFNLKEKQREVLKAVYEEKDCVGILPTGYGKSVIFQLLPYFLQRIFVLEKPMLVIVVCPLNSLMENQCVALWEKGLRVCMLNIEGTKGTTYSIDDKSSSDEDEQGDSEVHVPKCVQLSDIREGNVDLMYAHPEALFAGKTMTKILRSEAYSKRLGAIVVDEVHIVTECGDSFRSTFKKLGELTCLFPKANHLALSATCTPSNINRIVQILQHDNPTFIKVNPDRPNIYLEVKKRLPNIRKYEKWDAIFVPLASQLLLELDAFPLTIVYMESLEALGYAYQYFSNTLKEKQYIPTDVKIPENRIFAQFHTDYTPEIKHQIVMELRKPNPKIRVILATVALGMGLDAPSISQVIHCRPPTTLENYLQEFGRAGRSGQRASALLYYNSSDIASNRKGISQAMVDYCKNTKHCFRLLIVKHFGFENVVFSGLPLDCCSNCANWNDDLLQ